MHASTSMPRDAWRDISSCECTARLHAKVDKGPTFLLEVCVQTANIACQILTDDFGW